MATIARDRTFVELPGLRLELERRGRGEPLLLLSGEEALEADAPFVEALAATHEVLIPSPPGFGRSERPESITSPDDVAYVYLDLVERLGLRGVPVVGCSLGGWIAAEMAIKDDAFVSKLVLVDPYGIKIGGPTDRDIADLWMLHPEAVKRLKWHDVAKGERDYRALPEDELAIIARNNESFVRLCWEPCLYDPKLAGRLHRIRVPTLLVWGAGDGVVKPSYGEAYASLIPDARFELVPQAGHFPHLERPEIVLDLIRRFLSA